MFPCVAKYSARHSPLDNSPQTRTTTAMSLDAKYPALSDLRAHAMRRIPRFVWEYLDSATGTEATQARNRAELDKVTLLPSILHGEVTSDLSANLMGQTYPLPFGIAPVGMSGLI